MGWPGSYLVHLVHVVLRVPSRALGGDGMSSRGRPRARPHHAVGGAWGRARARAQHGSGRGAGARGGAGPGSPAQRRVRSGHLPRSCRQRPPAGKKHWSVLGPGPCGQVQGTRRGAARSLALSPGLGDSSDKVTCLGHVQPAQLPAHKGVARGQPWRLPGSSPEVAPGVLMSLRWLSTCQSFQSQQKVQQVWRQGSPVIPTLGLKQEVT